LVVLGPKFLPGLAAFRDRLEDLDFVVIVLQRELFSEGLEDR